MSTCPTSTCTYGACCDNACVTSCPKGCALCYTFTYYDYTYVSPSNTSTGLEWWIILIIVIATLLLLVGIIVCAVCILRCVKRKA